MVLIEIKSAVKQERKYFEKILSYLEIIENEKLFIPEYNSMFDYCRKELGYTDSESQRRIDAMRTLRRHPILKEKLADGDLTLSQISLLGSIELEARRENLPMPDMKELLPNILNKSVKETEEIIRDRIKLPPKKHKITIEVSEEGLKKWKEFRHQNHKKSSETLLVDLIDTQFNSQEIPVLRKEVHKARSSKTMNQIKRKQAKGKCSVKGCENTYNTEVDHIVPVSKGGKTELSNMRLLCKAHNLARNRGLFV